MCHSDNTHLGRIVGSNIVDPEQITARPRPDRANALFIFSQFATHQISFCSDLRLTGVIGQGIPVLSDITVKLYVNIDSDTMIPKMTFY